MAVYEVKIEPRADRQLRKLERPIQKRITAAIDALGTDPRPTGAKLLTGTDDLLRIRVGSYRVVYTVRDAKLLVLVVKLGHRRSVYREL